MTKITLKTGILIVLRTCKTVSRKPCKNREYNSDILQCSYCCNKNNEGPSSCNTTIYLSKLKQW